MIELRELSLPEGAFRLEERNLPDDLARSLAGCTVNVQVLPEEAARTQRVEAAEVKRAGISPAKLPGGYPLWIDPEGNFWND